MANEAVRLKAIPGGSVVTEGFGRVDYADSYAISASTDHSAKQIAEAFFDTPRWVDSLMWLRDRIVRVFGLKTGKDLSDENGEKRLFTTISETQDEIVMGESDRHLDFRVSVMIDRQGGCIITTTIVHFNNFWGKLYFLPVRPFHKVIVKSLMKRQIK